MIKNILLYSVFFAISTIAIADYSYDYNTGNSYITTPSYNGGATVQGFNVQTGSQWQTRIQGNGNMQGTDAQGNYWNYNAKSGVYYNSNGKTCYGTGASRTCY